jgi:radical SAM protein with 4Fe4S-binding SPASM domain
MKNDNEIQRWDNSVSHWKLTGGLLKKFFSLIKKGGLDYNFYMYRYKFRNFHKSHKVADFPIDVMVESTNQCNLKCIMCYHSDPLIPFQQDGRSKYMNLDLFKKIVDECSENKLYSMKLSFRGEPFMNKSFINMVKYAKSKNILEVSSLTNATLLTKEKAQQIIDLGLDQLIISMDGLTKKTYETVRIKSNYDTVIKNIHNLLELRGNKKKPFVRMQYTEVEENRHETKDFYDYWKNKVDEVSISYYVEFSSLEKSKASKNEIPIYDGFSCEQLWQRVVILSDGRVSLCGTDIVPNAIVGDVNHQSIKEIWNSKKLNKIRNLHKNNNYHKMPFCKICVQNQHASNEFESNTLFKN